MSNDLSPILLIIALIVAGFVIMAPYLIAKNRNHAYANIIAVLCVAAPLGGITWIIAIIWAIYPSDKSLVDPLLGNPTGTGSRNVGDTLGSVQYGKERGYQQERSLTEPSFARVEQTVKNTSNAQNLFNGEKSLKNDAYKLFLLEKYGVSKNDVLNQFVCNNKIFNAIEDVFEFTHKLELSASEKNINSILESNNNKTEPRFD
jgi:hypothetical protein